MYSYFIADTRSVDIQAMYKRDNNKTQRDKTPRNIYIVGNLITDFKIVCRLFVATTCDGLSPPMTVLPREGGVKEPKSGDFNCLQNKRRSHTVAY